MPARTLKSLLPKAAIRHFLLFFTALFVSVAPAALFSAEGLISGVSSYPNPFDSRSGEATLAYTLARDADVHLRIYNVYGAYVAGRDFAAGEAGGKQGANAANWNGTDAQGRKVAKGIYLAVIHTAGDRQVVKIGVIH